MVVGMFKKAVQHKALMNSNSVSQAILLEDLYMLTV